MLFGYLKSLTTVAKFLRQQCTPLAFDIQKNKDSEKNHQRHAEINPVEPFFGWHMHLRSFCFCTYNQVDVYIFYNISLSTMCS